jgi:hypothetical protein
MAVHHGRSTSTLDDMTTAATVQELLDRELARFGDRALAAKVREFAVEPYSQNRRWNYGAPGTTYPCWIVVDPPHLNVGIAYCEAGFGPRAPWGLLWLSNGGSDMGDDSGWFASLEEAAKDVFGAHVV